jgi:hypothetical protein
MPPGAVRPVPTCGVVRPGLVSAGSVSDGVVSAGAAAAGSRLGVVRPGVVSPGVVRPGVVSPGAVALGVVSPGVVSPGVVRPGVVSPEAVALGVVSPGVVRPGVVRPGLRLGEVSGPACTRLRAGRAEARRQRRQVDAELREPRLQRGHDLVGQVGHDRGTGELHVLGGLLAGGQLHDTDDSERAGDG